MEKLYSHQHLFFVEHMQNLLALEGIETKIKNQFLSGASGDVPVFETWPELWVVNPKQIPKAKELIANADAPQGEEWCCPSCKEFNAPSFEICWQCQHPRD
ncbi:DUF2007 domain-containing protein [Thalassotalea sp. PS06]|uniref:putative signal transducing protein n=1 Tax=Thalassotalea sp. PS06 TaxID=2594005 RepID=UPI001163B4EB|nr:DUF2007 domain-containing protein [Thalassotalea sp. PS06]QDP02512.1 DUF2007 domain-containing protein [Thalassotalea sp. PS06]